MLDADKASVIALPVDEDTNESMKIARSKLKAEGLIASPRRYSLMLDVMAAESWLQGFSSVVADSLIVGCNILWQKPEQIRLVNQVIRSSVNPNLAKAKEIQLAARAAYKELADNEATTEDMNQVVTQVRSFISELKALRQSQAISNIITELVESNTNLVQRMIGSN